jgi:hypothetical protein
VGAGGDVAAGRQRVGQPATEIDVQRLINEEVSIMLDTIIAIGRSHSEDYKIYKKMKDVVSDEGALGDLLWRAFRQGHGWVVSNLHLSHELTESKTPCSVDDFIQFVNHPQFTWCVYPRQHGDAHPRDSRMLYCKPQLALLIGATLRRAGGAALCDRLDEILQEPVRALVRLILALKGHVPPPMLPSALRSQVALTYLLDLGMLNILESIRPDHADAAQGLGLEVVWRDWWRAVVDAWCSDDTLARRVTHGGCLLQRHPSLVSVATCDELMRMMEGVHDVSWSLAQWIGRERPDLRPHVEARAEALLQRMDNAHIKEMDLIAGLLLFFYHQDGELAPPARFDALLSRVVRARYRSDDMGASALLADRVIHPEHIKWLPPERREAIALQQDPPWCFCHVCPTPDVLRAWVAGAVAISGNWSNAEAPINDALYKEPAEAFAPYVVEVIHQQFTLRACFIGALLKWRVPSTLPAVIALLSGDAKTRSMVSRGLKDWGEPILEHLNLALTSRALKVRTEAANILAALAATPLALEMAATHLRDEKNAHICAVLQPLAQEHSSRQQQKQQHTQPQRPCWQDRLHFDRVMKRGDWQTLTPWGPSAIDELIHWLRERPTIEARLAFWEDRISLTQYGWDDLPRQRLVTNIQRLVFACAERLAQRSTLCGEPLASAQRDVERWLGEETGADILASHGPGVLSVLAHRLLPTRSDWPETRRMFFDLFDGHNKIWRSINALFSHFCDNIDASEAHKKITQALTQPIHRSTLLAEARSVLAPYARPLSDAELAFIEENINDGWTHCIEERIGIASLVPVVDRLITRHAQGRFDNIWRCDVIPEVAWHKLVTLCLRFAPEQAPLRDDARALLDADPDTLNASFGDHWLNQLRDSVAIIAAPGPIDHSASLDFPYPMSERLSQFIGHFSEALMAEGRLDASILEVAVTLSQHTYRSIFGFKNHNNEERFRDKYICNSVDVILNAVSHLVIKSPQRTDEDKLLMLQKITLLMQAQEEGIREGFYKWLRLFTQPRCAAYIPHQHPVGALALLTLVSGLGDAKKSIRHVVQNLAVVVGEPALVYIWPLLASPKATIATQAAEALAQIPHPSSVPYINAALAQAKTAPLIAALTLARDKSQAVVANP